MTFQVPLSVIEGSDFNNTLDNSKKAKVSSDIITLSLWLKINVV